VGGESHASRPEQPWWVRDPGTPYEVSRLKIMEYAQAIGDPNPVYRDLDAARQAGYPDVIAPPTFAAVVALPASIAAVRIPSREPATRSSCTWSSGSSTRGRSGPEMCSRPNPR
jgi:acyl dehydratase